MGYKSKIYKSGFQKGYTPWNKGRKVVFSEEHRENLRKAKIGCKRRKYTEEEKKRHSLAMVGKYKGEKHHFWKGGISELRDLIRHSFEYRQWRSDVFTRDDYTCQVCFTRSGNGKRVDLNVDHIKLFALIIQENKITTVEEAKSCSELWNINNGRTLCVGCHRKTDSFGTKAHKLLKTL